MEYSWTTPYHPQGNGRAMKEAYNLTSAQAKKSADMGKRQYDKKVRHMALCEGDRVLVRNMTELGGPGKLRSYWEREIYVVTQKRKDMPVYEVKPESGNGRTRVLYQNLLLPCSFLPVETHLKSPKSSHALSRRTHKQQTSKEETTGTIDEDIPGLTHQLQEFYESTGHTEDSFGTVPELVEQDNYPCQDDGPESEGRSRRSGATKWCDS